MAPVAQVVMQFLRSFLDRFRRPPPSHADHGDEDETTRVVLGEVTFDDAGWLVDSDYTERVPTKRTQRLLAKRPRVMWHWTATRGAGRRLAQRIAAMPRPGERTSAWHLLIPERGKMVQSASALVGTPHAGGPSSSAFFLDGQDWKQSKVRLMSGRHPGEVSANSLMFGVELENVGQTKLVTSTYDVKAKLFRPVRPQHRGWPFAGSQAANRGPGPLVPDDEIVTIDGRTYHRFTEHQEHQAERLVRAFLARWPAMTRADFEWTHAKVNRNKPDTRPSWDGHLTCILDRVF